MRGGWCFVRVSAYDCVRAQVHALTHLDCAVLRALCFHAARMLIRPRRSADCLLCSSLCCSVFTLAGHLHQTNQPYTNPYSCCLDTGAILDPETGSQRRRCLDGTSCACSPRIYGGLFRVIGKSQNILIQTCGDHSHTHRLGYIL